MYEGIAGKPAKIVEPNIHRRLVTGSLAIPSQSLPPLLRIKPDSFLWTPSQALTLRAKAVCKARLVDAASAAIGFSKSPCLAPFSGGFDDDRLTPRVEAAPKLALGTSPHSTTQAMDSRERNHRIQHFRSDVSALVAFSGHVLGD